MFANIFFNKIIKIQTIFYFKSSSLISYFFSIFNIIQIFYTFKSFNFNTFSTLIQLLIFISIFHIYYLLQNIFMQPESQINQSDSFISDDSYISHIDKNYFKNISFFSKQFCLPKEIKLNQDRQGINSLENGLQIVQRADLEDITPISRDVGDATIRQIKESGQDHVRFTNGDGLISMFKHRVDLPIHIKVAICVTVYSEDKNMLKHSLQGIKANYKEFLQKAGILSHQIIVVVIFDGIQKMNNSKDSRENMISLFRDFDLMNGFRKKQYIVAKQHQGAYQQKPVNFADDDKFLLQNYDDDMIFTETQLDQLQDCLFSLQYKRYMQMCELIQYVKQLSKKDIQKLSLSQMPKKIKTFFIQRARKFLYQHNINNITQDDDQLQKYLQDNMPRQKLQMLKLQSIKEAQKVAKDYIKSRQSTAILYQMAIPIDNPNQKIDDQNQDANLRFHQTQPKMYAFFAVKHKNSGKLSSHLWFFQGFCNIIQPDVCILVDCGLKPADDAIFKMWAHIQTYKKTCGGVCGYMSLSQENPCDDLGYRNDQYDQQKVDCLTKLTSTFFDVQKAQMFQYHFAHMLDKPFEAWFGYIHVLPGAFSAYNWEALRHQKIKVKKKTGHLISQKQIQKKKKERILRKYLKTVIYNQTLQDIKQANMYLAEDRILCLQIYSKKDHHFNLQYLPDAESTVDPVTSLIRLLGQRKRWINGSWFALQYVLQNRKRVNESNHNNWNKFKFRSNMFYSAFNKALAYIGISLFFIIMHFMIQQFAQNQFLAQIKNSLDLKDQLSLNKAKIFYDFFSLRSLVNSLVGIVDFFYILLVGIAIYYSLTLNKHTQSSKKMFNFITTIFGIYGVMSVVLVFANFFSTVISKSNGTYEVSDSFIQSIGALNIDLFMYLLGLIVFVHLIIVLVSFDLMKYYQIVKSLPSYFFYVPTYIHTLFIYAFCRIDDLSWGTKGLEADNQKKQINIAYKFKNEKLRFVFKWIAVNVSLCLFCLSLANNKLFQTILIWVIAFYVIIILILRFLFAIVYLIKYYFIVKRHVKNTTLSERKRLERIHEGRKIKQNLINYIEQVKNYVLDQHVQQINQQLKNLSRLNKIIDQEEYHVVETKVGFSSLFQKNKNQKSHLSKRNSLEQSNSKLNNNTDNDNAFAHPNQNLKNQSMRSQKSQKVFKKRKQMKFNKKKIFAKANDNVPILAQIFNSRSNNFPNQQPIQYGDVIKLTQLQKVRQKVKRYKKFQNTSNLHVQVIHEDEQDGTSDKSDTKNKISTKPQLQETGGFQQRSKRKSFRDHINEQEVYE